MGRGGRPRTTRPEEDVVEHPVASESSSDEADDEGRQNEARSVQLFLPLSDIAWYMQVQDVIYHLQVSYQGCYYAAI